MGAYAKRKAKKRQVRGTWYLTFEVLYMRDKPRFKLKAKTERTALREARKLLEKLQAKNPTVDHDRPCVEHHARDRITVIRLK